MRAMYLNGCKVDIFIHLVLVRRQLLQFRLGMRGRGCGQVLYLCRPCAVYHPTTGNTRGHQRHHNPVSHLLPFRRTKRARTHQTRIHCPVLQDRPHSGKINSR